jgi:hypothetical protein
MSVAVIWGLIGLANVVEVFVGPPSSSAMRSFAFFFGVLFFLFPSLAFFAWGSSRNSRIKSAIPEAWSAAAGVTGAARVNGVEGVGEMPVWQLSWYAMKLPFEKLTAFLQMAIVPIAISFALRLPYAFFDRSKSPTDALAHIVQQGGAGPLVIIGVALALAFKLVIEIPFQVSWLRLVVLGESKAKGRGYFRFDETEKRYMRYAFLFLVISLPAAATSVWMLGFPKGSPAAGGAALVFLGLVSLTAIVWVRLVFVLPEIATNHFESLPGAWNQTSGIGLRMFAVIATATLPLMIASAVLFDLRGTSPGFLTYIFAMAVGVFFDYASRAAMLAAVGVAYRDWGICVSEAGREPAATVA